VCFIAILWQETFEVVSGNGESFTVILMNCKYVPSLFVNLFSLTKAIKNGWQLKSVGADLLLSSNRKEIKLGRSVLTENGHLVGIKMHPTENKSGLLLGERQLKMGINIFHTTIGHPGEKLLWQTSQFLNIELIGKFNVCKDCAIGKARQKNLNKENKNKSSIAGEQIYLDISSIQQTSFGGAQYWLLIVDESTKMKWSYF